MSKNDVINQIADDKNTYFLKVDQKTLPAGFVQKPVWRYYELSDRVQKSRLTYWIEIKSLDYYYSHIDIKSYRRFRRRTLTTLFLSLLLFLASLFILYDCYNREYVIPWLINATKGTHIADYVMLFALLFSLTAVAVSLLFILIYSYFVSAFFNMSFATYLKSDDYVRTCKKYSTYEAIYGLKYKTVKTLFRMKFINTSLWKMYHRNFGLRPRIRRFVTKIIAQLIKIFILPITFWYYLTRLFVRLISKHGKR